MSNRQVTYAKFHQGLFIPGVGNLGETLPSPSKSLNLYMCKEPEGLSLRVNGVYALVPWANVVLAVLSPESEQVKEAA